MQRAAVVVTGSEADRALLKEATACITGTDADVVVIGIVSESAYENDQQVIDAIESAEHTTFGNETPEEYAERATGSLADDAFADTDFEYTIEGHLVDDNQDQVILDASKRHNCDHIFLHGKRRSPAGKAVFGDTAQQVILNFDGYVTVASSE